MVVTNPSGPASRLPGGFTFDPFAIHAISPSLGLTGDIVQISGTGFHAGVKVTVDGAPASPTALTSTLIAVRVPAHAPGPVDVALTNTNDRQVTAAGGFAYAVVNNVSVSAA